MRQKIRAGVALLGAAVVLTACSSGGNGGSSTPPPTSTTGGGNVLAGINLSGQTLEVDAVWTSSEADEFKAVLNNFSQATHATVNYVSTGDSISTVVGGKLAGGKPPNIALFPQPGAIQQFAKQGALKPLPVDIQAEVKSNYQPFWQNLGTVNGTMYGVPFDASDKSLVWYNPATFSTAGISAPPTTWQDFTADAQKISDSGTPPLSVGAQDGWVLTDWFENIYLSQSGPAMYDKLAKHQIPWTDPSVGQALTTMAQLFGKPGFIPGGSPAAALQVDYPHSVTQVFSNPPVAGMVYEGGFVATNIPKTFAVGTDAKDFPFPKVGATQPTTGGGDTAVAFTDDPATMALMKYLASPDAAATRVKYGDTLSVNTALPLTAYPNDTVRAEAQQVLQAGDNFRFDMSDQAPAQFGGTKGAGEWAILQQFLTNLNDVQGTQQKLEQAAAGVPWTS